MHENSHPLYLVSRYLYIIQEVINTCDYKYCKYYITTFILWIDTLNIASFQYLMFVDTI